MYGMSPRLGYRQGYPRMRMMPPPMPMPMMPPPIIPPILPRPAYYDPRFGYPPPPPPPPMPMGPPVYRRPAFGPRFW